MDENQPSAGGAQHRINKNVEKINIYVIALFRILGNVLILQINNSNPNLKLFCKEYEDLCKTAINQWIRLGHSLFYLC